MIALLSPNAPELGASAASVKATVAELSEPNLIASSMLCIIFILTIGRRYSVDQSSSVACLIFSLYLNGSY